MWLLQLVLSSDQQVQHDYTEIGHSKTNSIFFWSNRLDNVKVLVNILGRCTSLVTYLPLSRQSVMFMQYHVLLNSTAITVTYTGL